MGSRPTHSSDKDCGQAEDLSDDDSHIVSTGFPEDAKAGVHAQGDEDDGEESANAKDRRNHWPSGLGVDDSVVDINPPLGRDIRRHDELCAHHLAECRPLVVSGLAVASRFNKLAVMVWIPA